MIGYYFTNTLQGSQFLPFHHIILGIHANYIPSYNASRRALLEEKKIQLEYDKEEAQKAAKLSGG